MVCTSKWVLALSFTACSMATSLTAVGQKTGSAPPAPQPIPVVVQNSPSQPVPATNPLSANNNPVALFASEAIEPYADQCKIDFGGSGGGFCSFNPLPEGKRLVVEEFDAGTGLPPFGLESGCQPLAIVLNVIGSFGHNFPATYIGTQASSGRDFYATHEKTRLYQPENAIASCNVTVGCFSQGKYTCQISGFLVGH